MSGYHRTEAIGNIGREPELKYMPSGEAVLNFSVAVNEKWKTKSGEAGEHTEWYTCTIFGKRAEALAQYINKGDRIHVAGRLRTRKWQDRDGGDRYTTDLRVDDVTLLGNAQSGGRRGQLPEHNSQGSSTAPGHSAPASQPPEPEYDDDIPF